MPADETTPAPQNAEAGAASGQLAANNSQRAFGEHVVQSDTPAAVEYMRRWAPDGLRVLTAIAPDRKGIATASFDPSEEEEMSQWIERFNGKRNIYYHVNPPMRRLEKKAEREDIKEVAWLHVDIDPRSPHKSVEDVEAFLEDEQNRLLDLAMDAPEGIPHPTAIVFSGGGYQMFWRLKKPIPINGDLGLAEDAKRYNVQLEIVYDADNCHNIDRIMRLPGTINVPDSKKAAKGRKPALAKVMHFGEEVYDLSDFTAADSPVVGSNGGTELPAVDVPDAPPRLDSIDDLDRWRVPGSIKVICLKGQNPDAPPKPSRSEWLLAAVCGMHRAGVDDSVIFSVITDPRFAISASVLDKENRSRAYALRQIARAKQFGATEAVPSAPAEGVDFLAEIDDVSEPRPATPKLVSIAAFDLDQIPLRRWLMEGLLMDGQVTLLVARGGTGKSLFALQAAIAVATGGEFAYWRAAEPRSVLVLNAEDDRHETQRRIAAACEAMGVDRESIAARLFCLDTSSLVLLEKENDKPKRTELYGQLQAIIKDNNVGLVVVDPLIETHVGLDENSNTEMKEVVVALRDLARFNGIPVLAVHHTRKNAGAGDQDGARGGSSVVNAVRIAITMTPAPKDSPPDDGRDPEWWRYIQLQTAKSNYSEKGGELWLRLETIEIGNAGDPVGDRCPALVAWEASGTDVAEREAPLSALPFLDDLLDAVERGRENGDPWLAGVEKSPHTQTWGLIHRDFGVGKSEAKAIFLRMCDEGWLVAVDAQSQHRKRIKAVRTYRELGWPRPPERPDEDPDNPII